MKVKILLHPIYSELEDKINTFLQDDEKITGTDYNSARFIKEIKDIKYVYCDNGYYSAMILYDWLRD